MADVTFVLKSVDAPTAVEAICSIYGCTSQVQSERNAFAKDLVIKQIESFINGALAEKHRKDVEAQIGSVQTVKIS